MRFLLVIFIALSVSACLSDPDCLVTTTNFTKVSFQESITDKVTLLKKDTAKAVSFTSIKVSGTDTPFETAGAITSVSLPVNPYDTLVTFKFTYDLGTTPPSSRTDSITVSYDKQNILISPTCGVFTFYSGLMVLSSSFPNKPTIFNSQLSTSVTTNIKVKF